jgi:hypothetical protein
MWNQASQFYFLIFIKVIEDINLKSVFVMPINASAKQFHVYVFIIRTIVFH